MAGDPFATLGLDPTFDLDTAAAEQRLRELLKATHPDRFAGAGAPERRRALHRSIDINEAWRAIREPLGRAEALLRRAGVAAPEAGQGNVSQALLVDFMDLREQLSEARSGRDLEQIRSLAAEVQRREAAALRRLSEGFSALLAPGSTPPADLTPRLTEATAELRYIRRFLDEVRAIEEE